MQGFPLAYRGMTVGLLGGSFDPAHEGHAHITREALKRFALDRVWWLVSPGNPLKVSGPAPMAERIVRARAVMDHPRVTISDIEARLGTRYTAETLRRLKAIYPGVRFVWLMGADNLIQVPHWENWQQIFHAVPVAVLARPTYSLRASSAKAAQRFRRGRLSEQRAAGLASREPPAWAFLHIRLSALSATQIRAARRG